MEAEQLLKNLTLPAHQTHMSQSFQDRKAERPIDDVLEDRYQHPEKRRKLGPTLN